MEIENRRIEYLQLDELYFDPDNPRLPSELQGSEDEGQVLVHMLRDEGLPELMKSIGESGYSASEPLLVVPRKSGEGYLVVEGNRRLAALKLLEQPELATVRTKTVKDASDDKQVSSTSIPAIVYEKREDVLDYLGYRHITGVKSWGALEKARYLKQLFDRHKGEGNADFVFKKLAKMIGSRSDYVAKLLSAYNLYEHAKENAYFGIGIEEKDIEFSLLSTATSYENIYNYIGLESNGDLNLDHVVDENFAFLFHRLFDPKLKISDSRQLSDLSAVIGNEIALEEYKNGASLSEALYFTSAPVDAFRNFLSVAQSALDNAWGSIDRLPDDFPEKESVVEDLHALEKRARLIRGALTPNRD